MPAGSSILPSIVRNVLLSCAIQAAVLLGAGIAWGIDLAWVAGALSAALAWNAFLGGVLALRRADFRLEATGVALSRVNLSNTLTVFRLSSIPAIVFFLLAAHDGYPVLAVALPFLGVVFATDFVDGIVARRRGEITFIGRYLDSGSDYAMIISLSILLYVAGRIPWWLFWPVMGRLVLFALGMGWASLRQRRILPIATFLGKASVAAVMVLYGFEVAGMFSVPGIGDPTLIRVLEIACLVIVSASLVDKAAFLGRLLGGERPQRPST